MAWARSTFAKKRPSFCDWRAAYLRTARCAGIFMAERLQQQAKEIDEDTAAQPRHGARQDERLGEASD